LGAGLVFLSADIDIVSFIIKRAVVIMQFILQYRTRQSGDATKYRLP